VFGGHIYLKKICGFDAGVVQSLTLKPTLIVTCQ